MSHSFISTKHRDQSSDPSSQIELMVVSAFPEKFNTNSALQDYVTWGFESILGKGKVLSCPLEIAPDLVMQFKPKLIVIFGSCMLDISAYRATRVACDKAGSGMAFWLHDDPYEFDYAFKAEEVADWIFSNDRWSAMHYAHPKVMHLPMGASKQAHFRPWVDHKETDIAFCGVAFPNRIQLVKDLSPILAQYRSRICGSHWPTELTIAKNERLTNTELSNLYATSTVTLNMGRQFNLANDKFLLDASTPGPRTFEAAMAGTVQCYFVESLEITDYFKPDEEIILFDSPTDFALQVERLIEEPSLAKKIALAAQERTLRDHTYEARCKQILSFCEFSI